MFIYFFQINFIYVVFQINFIYMISMLIAACRIDVCVHWKKKMSSFSGVSCVSQSIAAILTI